MKSEKTITGVERTFPKNEMIVTKTDLKGFITYANAVFIRISGYPEAELLGQPHNLIRHPEMPRVVFSMLWETIRGGREFFGYIKNLSKNGDHYWVFAHVTPHVDAGGTITGYHSSRRFPERPAIEAIVPIYDQLLNEQQRHNTRDRGLRASMDVLNNLIQQRGYDSYNRFMLSL